MLSTARIPLVEVLHPWVLWEGPESELHEIRVGKLEQHFTGLEIACIREMPAVVNSFDAVPIAPPRWINSSGVHFWTFGPSGP